MSQRASQETGPGVRCTNRVPRGTKESPDVRMHTARLAPISSLHLLLITAAASPGFAAEVHGRVTDPLGAPVAGAELALIEGGKIVATGRSAPDGTLFVAHGRDRSFLCRGGEPDLPADFDAVLLCGSAGFSSAECCAGARRASTSRSW